MSHTTLTCIALLALAGACNDESGDPAAGGQTASGGSSADGAAPGSGAGNQTGGGGAGEGGAASSGGASSANGGAGGAGGNGGANVDPGHPNEPAGMTPISEIVFQEQVLPVEIAYKTSGYGILNGGWMRTTGGCAAALVDAPDAPVDAPEVYQWNYGNGHSYGNGCSRLVGWEGDPGDVESKGKHSYGEYYESGHFRLLGANGAGPTAEMGGDGFKLLGYFGVGCKNTNQGNGTELIGWGRNTVNTSHNNIQVDQLKLDFRHQGCVTQPDGSVNRNYNQNKSGTFPIHVGSWHHYELNFVLNDVGQDNGVIRGYVDGVLVNEYSDVRFRNAMHDRGFYLRHFNPVFNGNPHVTEAQQKTESTFLQVSDIYISVKNAID